MAEPVLAVQDLIFSYQDGTRALKGFSADIGKGERVALLGPNGAGKSTLFMHFNGLLRPQGGKVCLHGKPVSYTRAGLKELRQRVGLVFQDPDSQLFSSSIYQDVSFGPYNLGLPRQEINSRVEYALEATGLTPLKERPTHSLSFGQKKLVAVAGVLAMEPEVLVFDEPTAGLDPKHANLIMDLLGDFHSRGATVVLSTHDPDLAYSFAERILVMEDGTLAASGPPGEVFLDHGLLERTHLHPPLVLEVYRELVQAGMVIPSGEPPRNRQQLINTIKSGA